MATQTLKLVPVAGQRELQPSLCVSGASSVSSGSASCLTASEAKGGDASPRSGGDSRGMGAANLDASGQGGGVEGLSASSDALAFLGADELPLNGSCREAPQAPIGGPCSGLKGAHLGDSLLVEGYDDSSVDCQLSAAEKWADMLECGAEDILQFSYEDIAGPIDQMILPEPAIVSEAFPEEDALAKESGGRVGEVMDWDNLSLPDIYDFCAGSGTASQAQRLQRVGCKRDPEEDLCGIVEDLALGPVPMRARSKRARAARKGWSRTFLIHLLEQPTRRRAAVAGVQSKERAEEYTIHAPTGSGASSGTVISCTNEGSAGQVDSPAGGGSGEDTGTGTGCSPSGGNKRGSPYTETGAMRRCSHCSTAKTPQWRAGPNGPKTLCNACGVRYKSGRLCPEYRPASSPEFEADKHSNSHRKIVEMRKCRDAGAEGADGEGSGDGKPLVASKPLPRPPVGLKRSKKPSSTHRGQPPKVQAHSSAARVQNDEPALPKSEAQAEQEQTLVTPLKEEARSAAPCTESSPLSPQSSSPESTNTSRTRKEASSPFSPTATKKKFPSTSSPSSPASPQSTSPGSTNMSCNTKEAPSSPPSPSSQPSAPGSQASIGSVRSLSSVQLSGLPVHPTGACTQLGKQGGASAGTAGKEAVGPAPSGAASGHSKAEALDALLQAEAKRLKPATSSAHASFITVPQPKAPEAEGPAASCAAAAPPALQETDREPRLEAAKAGQNGAPTAAHESNGLVPLSGQKDEAAAFSDCEPPLSALRAKGRAGLEAEQKAQPQPQQQRPKLRPQKQPQVFAQQIPPEQKHVLKIQPKPWHGQPRLAGTRVVGAHPQMAHHISLQGPQRMARMGHMAHPQGAPMVYPPALPHVPFVQLPHYPSPPLQHLLHQQHMPVPAAQPPRVFRWPEANPGHAEGQLGGPLAQRRAGSPMARKVAGSQSPLPPAPAPAMAGSPVKAGPLVAQAISQESPERPGYAPGAPMSTPSRADGSKLEPAPVKGGPHAGCGGGREGEQGPSAERAPVPGSGRQAGEQERLRGQLRKRQEMGQSMRRQMGTGGPASFSPSPSPPPVAAAAPAPPSAAVLSHCLPPISSASPQKGSAGVRKEQDGAAESLPISVAYHHAPPDAPSSTPAV